MIARGADVIMLPMFYTAQEAKEFVSYVSGRAKTMLLVETIEAEKNLEEIAKVEGIDEIHIGLNDLHLAYHKRFMFQLLLKEMWIVCVRLSKELGCPMDLEGLQNWMEEPSRLVILSLNINGWHQAEPYYPGVFMIRLEMTRKLLWSKYFNREFRKFANLKRGLKTRQNNILNKIVSVYKKRSQPLLKRWRKRKMIKNKEQLRCLIADYGDAFYLLNSTQFKKNFTELKESFVAIYPNFNIAYSYKTNYTPKLCRLENELGGYAEVVSDMEMEIALRVGVTPEKIIWNGPYKNMQKVEELLLKGGIVNLDSIYEIEKINMIAKKFPETILNIGIRCNFDISDGVVSRFDLM